MKIINLVGSNIMKKDIDIVIKISQHIIKSNAKCIALKMLNI